MIQKVRVGLVGARFGMHNALAMERNPRADVVAFCDLDEPQMGELAREFDHPIRFYTDYRDLCRDEEIDCVLVWVPNALHVPIALEAVKNGKHVMVTKPLADSLDAGRKLVDAAEAAGVVNMMSLSTRFGRAVEFLGEAASHGELGEIYFARAQSVRRTGIPGPSFIREGGGAFRDMGVHVLDSAWWVMGMPRPVSVTGVAGAKFGPRGLGRSDFGGGAVEYSVEDYKRDFAVDDYGVGLIRFDNGAVLEVESFWASHQPPGMFLSFFGTDGGATSNPLAVYRTDYTPEGRAAAQRDTMIELSAPGPTYAWDNIAEQFIACMIDGAENPAPLRHGLVVQQMLEGVLESSRTGREVLIE